MADHSERQSAIDAHGIIGNMRSAALVNDKGNVDFFCWPEFDSPSIFCSLLDGPEAGIFQSNYRGRWREMVNRSALALKLLTSRKHGAILAAATFGLPEVPGGERNWDYRYIWIRDASFTVYAFMRLGFVEEANAYTRWLRGRVRDCRGKTMKLNILYAIDGRQELPEVELPHLAGHGGATPVRIGNQAYDQIQLDIFAS